ncbi:hypothetical protein F2Q70_00018301 [Brassica cretica]|uniref:Uncharacterized protein n=1 Tax=Brassica cretica TaxID=69181 RepID=A0A8S9HU51_BRACR|nr:hypothetical protein F2Q70_00018301 [Brassica cretica]
MSLITVCFGSLLSFSRIRSIIGEGEGDSLSLSMIPLRDGHDPSLCRSSRKRDPLSPCLVDETTMLALFVAPRGNEDGPLSRWLSSRTEITDYLPLRGCPRRRRTALCVSVDLLELEGSILSRGGSRRRRYMALCQWISSTAPEVSVDGSDSLRSNKRFMWLASVNIWSEIHHTRFINTDKCQVLTH